MSERPICFAIAGMALAAMVAQVIVCLEQFAPVTVAESVWYLLGFFTILTNLSLVGLFTAIGLGFRVAPRLRGALALATSCVGIVFHLLLADQFDFEGLAWWADIALHTLIPLAVIGWWFAFTTADQVQWTDPLRWVLFPIAYGIYALVRGPLNLSEHYPYGFLDPTRIGYDGVALVFVGLAVGLVLMGMGMIACVKVRAARTKGTHTTLR